MKRAEINRISAEKQQMILDYMRDAGRPLSVKEIFEALPLSHNDIRNQFGNLKVKKAIERTERGPYGYEYVIASGKEPKKETRATWMELVEKAKKETKAGDVYYYIHEDGRKKRTRVTDTRYPHICMFDNGHAYLWADVARCRADKRNRILGEWPK